MIDTKNSSTAYVVMYKLITFFIMVFGLQQEDGSYNYSHGVGTSSASH